MHKESSTFLFCSIATFGQPNNKDAARTLFFLITIAVENYSLHKLGSAPHRCSMNIQVAVKSRI